MAVLTGNDLPIDFTDDIYLPLRGLNIRPTSTATQVIANSEDGAGTPYRILLNGDGFTYSGQTLTGGTITSIQAFDSATGLPIYTLSGIARNGPELIQFVETRSNLAFFDTIFGGDDQIIASQADDRLFSESGNDIIDGRGGNDTLVMNGPANKFTIVNWDGQVSVVSLTTAQFTEDGADRLFGIELIEFKDGTVGTPGPNFEPLDYIASYGDLAAAIGVNEEAGFSHFINFGAIEDRTVTFDGLEYIASQGDLIAAFGAGATQEQGASHFITNGRLEGRVVTFDGLEYIASQGDLIAAFGAGATQEQGASHFITNGRLEGRAVTFDGLEYIASHIDLLQGFGRDATSDEGAQHYIAFGFNEGRQVTFDGLSYIAANGDLITAFGADATDDEGAAHYVASGRSESRDTSFDAVTYVNKYADLASLSGETAIVHFIQFGFAEGRTDEI